MIIRILRPLALFTVLAASLAWAQNPPDSHGLTPFLDNAGTPDPNVPIIDEDAVLLCIGMSQAHWECGGDPDDNSSPGWVSRSTLPITIVDGALGGWHIQSILADPDTYWAGVEDRLRDAGFTNADVQVMWGKNATITAQTNPDVMAHRMDLRDGLVQLQQQAEARFPNLRAGFHSSRVYGGHCDINPEPLAHDSYNAIVGWDTEAGAIDSSSKWFLGPYIWADGTNARADGLTWLVTDFVMDPRPSAGCHPSQSGIDKVANQNEIFFAQLTYAPPGGPPPTAPEAPSALVATATSDMGIDLSWTDNSTDETNFHVERATGQGGTFAEIATTAMNVTSYDSRGLASDTEYCYRVRASNANGNSAYTAMACATTEAAAPPPPPTPPPPPPPPVTNSGGGGAIAVTELGILLLAGLLGLRRRKVAQ